MFYAIDLIDGEWVDLGKSRDPRILATKYPDAYIIGGW